MTAVPPLAVNFYQLASRPAAAVLPALAAKALAAGHRIVVRGAAAVLQTLDNALWTQGADSFVPHGIDSDLGPVRAARQPLLLTMAPLPAANCADCLMQVGDDLPDDLTGLARALYLFGSDDVTVARARWRRLKTQADIVPAYWREAAGGRFEQAG